MPEKRLGFSYGKARGASKRSLALVEDYERGRWLPLFSMKIDITRQN
jgi:hypothetical protein